LAENVHVVVTCTNRKAVPPVAALTLRTLTALSVSERFREWTRRLARQKGETLAANDLYAGDHWQVVRSLPDVAQTSGLSLFTWVCSAGYGLIPLDACLHPYAATFSTGHPDSVAADAKNGSATVARQQWWRLLSGWQGPSAEAPRSITDLASIQKDTILLLALSPPYLEAIEEDLAGAMRITGPERCAIFCAGATGHHTLGEQLIPCDARLQQTLGGARTSLNVRCLRRALERKGKGGLTAGSLRAYFTGLLRRQPELDQVRRRQLSDDEVRAFLQAAFRKTPEARPTPLLERLRESGRACERARFASLFQEVKGGRSNG
jgi:hypothetical protein